MTGCKRERRSFRRSREVSVLEKLAIRVVGKFAHNGIFSGNRMLTFFFFFSRSYIYGFGVLYSTTLFLFIRTARACSPADAQGRLVIRES